MTRSRAAAERPWVVAHNAASLDGRLTLGPGVLLLHGDERWAANAGAADPYARLLRDYAPDAVLEGSGSFVLEDSALEQWAEAPARQREAYHDFLPDAVVGRLGHRGWFVVVDGRGRIRWTFKEYPDPAWAGWHLLVLTCRQTPAAYLAYLRHEEIPYIVAGDEHVDLESALGTMGASLGVRRVLATGGGRLGGTLLRAGLIDEIDLDLAPVLIGGDTTPSLFAGRPLDRTEWPTRLDLKAVWLEDSHVFVRATVVRGDRAGRRDSQGARSRC